MFAIRALAIVIAIAALSSAPAVGENWPTRPLTMVIPTGAGGPSDVAGQILAAGMSEALGRPVIVEAIGGAGGMTAVLHVSRAAPDGYQFLMGSASTLAWN